MFGATTCNNQDSHNRNDSQNQKFLLHYYLIPLLYFVTIHNLILTNKGTDGNINITIYINFLNILHNILHYLLFNAHPKNSLSIKIYPKHKDTRVQGDTGVFVF